MESKAKDIKITVEFFVFQEDGAYIAYCPSLELSTSDASYNGAISSFYEMLQLHMEYCTDNNTLFDDLKAHGWKVGGGRVVPPTFASLMKKPEMKKLMNGNIGFEKVVGPAKVMAQV